MYTILGATGNIGSVITKKLLEKGEKVRVVGRNAARLQGFVQKGAEAFVADAKDASVLTQALTGVRAAFLMRRRITLWSRTRCPTRLPQR